MDCTFKYVNLGVHITIHFQLFSLFLYFYLQITATDVQKTFFKYFLISIKAIIINKKYA